MAAWGPNKQKRTCFRGPTSAQSIALTAKIKWRRYGALPAQPAKANLQIEVRNQPGVNMLKDPALVGGGDVPHEISRAPACCCGIGSPLPDAWLWPDGFSCCKSGSGTEKGDSGAPAARCDSGEPKFL